MKVSVSLVLGLVMAVSPVVSTPQVSAEQSAKKVSATTTKAKKTSTSKAGSKSLSAKSQKAGLASRAKLNDKVYRKPGSAKSPTKQVASAAPLKKLAPEKIETTPASKAEVLSVFDDRVVASIDGEPVTISDLRPLYRLNAERADAAIPETGPVLRRLVEEYVTIKLIEREAQTLGQTVSDEEMTAYIDAVLKQNNVEMSGFQSMLTERGMTLEAYKNQIRGEILRSRVIGSRLRSKIAVSDRDIKKYVGNEPATETVPAKGLHFEQIFIPKKTELTLDSVPESEDSSTEGAGESQTQEEKASALLQRIENGEKFAEVGGDYYVDLGHVSVEDLITEIQDAAGTLSEDETSSVVEGERGYYILRRVSDEANAEVSEEPKMADDVREHARKELTEERSKGEIEKYIREELPKKYNVEIKV